MTEAIKSSVVRIWTSRENGIVVGAGFLVKKRSILTCAHVIAQALGIPATTVDPPQGTIWLDFPLLSLKERVPAEVVQWHPVLPDGRGDIAGLELSQDPPVGAEAVRFVSAQAVWGHTFSVCGFPTGQDNGVWATGQLLERQALDWLLVEGVKAQGYSIGQGFSGAPVWDMELEGIVGMVVAASYPADLKAAFVIPTDVLLEAWPLIATPEDEPRNPYKGLFPFKKDDAGDFFGRERLTSECIRTLGEVLVSKQPGVTSKRFLAIIGPSGSGKSSVMMAGIFPRLQQGGLPGSEHWIYLDPIVPGKYPLEALAVTIAKQLPDRSVTSIREDLKDETTRGLYLLTALMRQRSDTNIVLFVDQFEELFTQTESEEERQRFINILLTASGEPQGSLIVLLTLRADFYHRPMQYPELAQLIQKHQVLVLPMNMTELRAVIERPAALPDVLLTFESGLVDELLFEMRGQEAALPLLQFTLEQLFQKRHGHRLTLRAYQDLGGIKGALARHAEETYSNLPSDDHRRLARTLFIRLIDPGTAEQDTTRRRAALSEFLLDDTRQTRLLQETMDIFIASRLLMTNEVAGTTTVEVSHEALIREWPRLSGWVREVREDLPLQQTLSRDVAEWERSGKSRDRLYRGSQLKAAESWAKRNTLSKQEALFLRASRIHQQRRRINAAGLVLASVLVTGFAAQLLLLFRPSWCPLFLCLPSQPLFQKESVHDNNLEVSFHAIQSSSHMLTGDPSTYTLSNLPTEANVQLVDKSQLLPYRVVIGVHSLLQLGGFPICIEQVAIVITKQARVIPYPLQVWIEDNVPSFNNNVYRVTYKGEAAGIMLPALHVPQPLESVQLVPGESDELAVQVLSHVIVDLHFQVRIAYRVVNESRLHTLTLPNVFEVMYSDLSNWHPYYLQGSHLVPAS